MNVFFVFDDGSLVTPPLGGTILPGITRASLITLANDKGVAVREDRYSIDQWRTDASSGRLREAFGCGTAAVVTPIGTVRSRDGEFKIGNGGPGTKTEELKATLLGIQRGLTADPHGWIHKSFYRPAGLGTFPFASPPPNSSPHPHTPPTSVFNH